MIMIHNNIIFFTSYKKSLKKFLGLSVLKWILKNDKLVLRQSDGAIFK